MRKRDFFFEDNCKRESGGTRELQQSRRRNPEELLEQARKAEDTRDIMAAIDYCQEALAIEPQYSDARIYSRHLARKKEGCEATIREIRYSTTKSIVEKANLLKIVSVGFHSHPDVIALSAVILPRLEEHDEYMRRGIWRWKRERWESAESHIEMALRVSPNSKEAQQALRCIKRRQPSYCFHFSRIELDPDYVWIELQSCFERFRLNHNL